MFTRRVTPRKIFVVKIDVRKIVRLEISDPIVRLGLKKGTLFNANDVAGAVQLNLLWNGFRLRSSARHRLTLQCQLQTKRGPQLYRRVLIELLNLVRQPNPQIG